ncbi:MAG: hypothetical protein N3A38_01970 [Planctomycetota bacterium]|nr:hypothetical protein [Planctomycetota bacterium]
MRKMALELRCDFDGEAARGDAPIYLKTTSFAFRTAPEQRVSRDVLMKLVRTRMARWSAGKASRPIE